MLSGLGLAVPPSRRLVLPPSLSQWAGPDFPAALHAFLPRGRAVLPRCGFVSARRLKMRRPAPHALVTVGQILSRSTLCVELRTCLCWLTVTSHV